MIVRVKYCGGCNPRYDRTLLLERLKEAFPEITFQGESSAQAAAGLVICGCSAACARPEDCMGPAGRFIIWQESAFAALCEYLRQLS